MLITESKLRKVIREVIKENHNQVSINEVKAGDAVRSAVIALTALGVTVPLAKQLVDTALQSVHKSPSRPSIYNGVDVDVDPAFGALNASQISDENTENIAVKLSTMTDNEIKANYSKDELRKILTKLVHMESKGHPTNYTKGQEVQPEVIERLEDILGNDAMMYTR